MTRIVKTSESYSILNENLGEVLLSIYEDGRIKIKLPSLKIKKHTQKQLIQGIEQLKSDIQSIDMSKITPNG
jgi:hypothetical protein